jgi:hypothetical protein
MAQPPPSLEDKSEIVELAAAEGHDAEIPSNAGYITVAGALEKVISRPRSVKASSTKSIPSTRHQRSKEIDIEKEASTAPQSESADEEAAKEEAVVDPNIVTWDGDDDPQKYAQSPGQTVTSNIDTDSTQVP